MAYHVGSYASSGFHDSAWDVTGQVNHESAPDLFALMSREINSVLSGNIKDEEIDSAKLFSLGRYQMGAQTVSQISSFYTNRYFADDFIKDYSKVPDSINKVTRGQIIKTAQQFIDADTWVLAAVSDGDREEVLDLGGKLEQLFNKR